MKETITLTLHRQDASVIQRTLTDALTLGTLSETDKGKINRVLNKISKQRVEQYKSQKALAELKKIFTGLVIDPENGVQYAKKRKRL